jgi:short-subunit dehydrogenase
MRYERAIVTGASRGLGLAVGHALASRGLDVVLASRTRPENEALPWVETDVSSPESVAALFAAARGRGPVDVLVNNAGLAYPGPFAEQTVEQIRETLDVDLLGAMLCAREALAGMLELRRGLVVNVGSDLSRRYAPDLAVYTAAKFGLLGFSGALLRGVKDAGVKVTAVLPGVVDTAFGGFGEEGSRGERHGMPAAHLAEQIAALLDLPEHVVVDEITLHPVGQEF